MKLKNHSLAVAALLFFINGACFAQSALPQLPDTGRCREAQGLPAKELSESLGTL